MGNRTRESRKTERVEVRVSPAVRDALERASSLSGRSLSDFIVSSAFDAARQTICDGQEARSGTR